jgi:hypothetical protein
MKKCMWGFSSMQSIPFLFMEDLLLTVRDRLPRPGGGACLVRLIAIFTMRVSRRFVMNFGDIFST